MSAGGRRGSKTLARWTKLKDQAKHPTPVVEQEPKVSQRTHDRTIKEREELKKSLDASLKDNAKLKLTIYNITKKVMNTANPTPFLTGSEKDPSDVSEDELIDMIGKLVPVEHNVSLEARLEELETRITLLNSELGKLLKSKQNLEYSLRELDTCQDLEVMKLSVKKIWLQSCSTKLYANDILHLDDVDDIDHKQSNSPQNGIVKTNGVQVHIPPSVQVNLRKVEITPPSGKKVPGDTHIKNMQPELRQLVIQDLSLYKGSGCDWRVFAQRVGIAEQMVQQWQEMKLPQPMKNVLGVWSMSPAATVRLLHRHLVSPQLRCVILGKRISDYYEVD